MQTTGKCGNLALKSSNSRCHGWKADNILKSEKKSVQSANIWWKGMKLLCGVWIWRQICWKIFALHSLRSPFFINFWTIRKISFDHHNHPADHTWLWMISSLMRRLSCRKSMVAALSDKPRSASTWEVYWFEFLILLIHLENSRAKVKHQDQGHIS